MQMYFIFIDNTKRGENIVQKKKNRKSDKILDTKLTKYTYIDNNRQVYLLGIYNSYFTSTTISIYLINTETEPNNAKKKGQYF